MSSADDLRHWSGPDLVWPFDKTTLGEALQRPNQTSRSLVGHRAGLVGFGQYYSPRARWLRLARLIISPRCRGRGVIATLVDTLIEDASKRDAFRAVELGVYAENTAALSAYRRLGFEPVDNSARPDVITLARAVNQ